MPEVSCWCLLSPSAPVYRSNRTFVALCYGVVCHVCHVCHVCFALTVLTMMGAMFFGMSRSVGGLANPWSWIANAALLLQFPVLQSALLTTRGRRVITRLAPRGTGSTLATTTYVTIASAQVFMLFALWSPSGIIWWQAHGVALGVMVALYAASWLLLGKAMATAGLSVQTGSLGWTALLRGNKPVYPKMPDTGLFRLTRQPIYVAFALTLWTVATWTPDQLVVALVLTGYCLIGPLFKEARFHRIYGAEFEKYANSVPYWLPWPRKRT
jgi:protein-S-isoprenylcysteine O-methyltransferase Ste14